METPKTKAGDLTERIMAIFWVGQDAIKLDTSQYNKVYSHVLNTLQKAGV